MAADDLDAVRRLADSVNEAPQWTRAAYEHYLPEAEPNRRIFLAEIDGVLAGFVAGQAVADTCELESIVVDAPFRRRGVGHALLTSLIGWARKQGVSQVQLEVRAGNSQAISLYLHSDFQRDGLRRNYYHHPGENAVLMSLSLRPQSGDENFSSETH